MKDWRNSPDEPYSDRNGTEGHEGVLHSVPGNIALGFALAAAGVALIVAPWFLPLDLFMSVVTFWLIAVIPFGLAAWLWMVAFRKSVWRTLNPNR